MHLRLLQAFFKLSKKQFEGLPSGSSRGSPVLPRGIYLRRRPGPLGQTNSDSRFDLRLVFRPVQGLIRKDCNVGRMQVRLSSLTQS